MSGQFRFYVQLFTVCFVSLKRYEIKVHFVGLIMHKIMVCFVDWKS